MFNLQEHGRLCHLGECFCCSAARSLFIYKMPLQVDSSKLKRTVMTYNDELDDFDLMTS